MPFVEGPSAKTELGKRIRQQTGAASVLVDRWVEEIGRPVLKGAEDETIQPGNAATASSALLRLSDRNLVTAELAADREIG